MAEEPDQNALAIIEELWQRIGERLTQISAPEGGWTVESMSEAIQGALSNATSAHSAVQAAVSEVNSANKGKLLEIGENGTISVPAPLEGEPGATSPTLGIGSPARSAPTSRTLLLRSAQSPWSTGRAARSSSRRLTWGLDRLMPL